MDFYCPFCGSLMVHEGTMPNRRVQTWTCGGPNQDHEVTLRSRQKVLEKKPE